MDEWPKIHNVEENTRKGYGVDRYGSSVLVR